MPRRQVTHAAGVGEPWYAMAHADSIASRRPQPRGKDRYMAGFLRIHIAFNFVYSLEHKEAHI
jgi:hypothetical protein